MTPALRRSSAFTAVATESEEKRMNHEVLEEAVLQPPARSALAELTTAPAIGTPSRAASRGNKTVRVAIVHDWLVTYAGAEKVLEQIVACFPDADLFSLVDFLDDRSFLRGKPVTTSFIQKLPLARTKLPHLSAADAARHRATRCVRVRRRDL